jgi:hypothetical protein
MRWTALCPLILAVATTAWTDWPGDPAVNVPLCVAGGDQWTSAASAVADGTGGAIVAWIDMRDGDANVYAQRVDALGETVWPANGVPVCDAAGSQGSVQAVTDGAGGAILVWLDDRGSDPDYYAQRVDASGEVLWPAGSPSTDGVPVVEVAGRQEHLVVVADGAGGVVVAWRHDDPVDDGIYAQRIGSLGELQWPGGAPSAAGVPVCEDDGAQLWPGLDADGAGGAVIAWADGRDGATTQTDVYAQRLDAGGSRLWTFEGVPLCQADYGQTHAVVAGDGAGGAIVAWEDPRTVGTEQGIYAQRLSSTGSVMWTPQDGVLVCDTYSGGELGLQAHPDGAGGAYLVWMDVRNAAATGLDLYAQRVSGSGAELWGAADVVVTAASDRQQAFDAHSLGPGGVIVSWTDLRPDTFTDVYAQRLDGLGSAAGPADGLAVCTAFSSQHHSSVVGDGGGGAIIAWYDYRDSGTTGSDVYAQRVFSDAPFFADGFESGSTSAWAGTSR